MFHYDQNPFYNNVLYVEYICNRYSPILTSEWSKIRRIYIIAREKQIRL